VLGYLNERDAVVKTLGDRFKAQPGEIVERVLALQDELKATGKALAAAQGLAEQLGDGAAVVLGGLPDPGDLGKVILVAAFGPAVMEAGLKAGAFIGGIAKLCGGGGGGRPNLAQAGGRDGAALDCALEQARAQLQAALG